MPLAPELLETALAQGRLSHAYLLIGASAVQSTRVFLRRLYCPSGSCGHCPTCRKLDRNSHPDVRWLRKGNKRIGIEQIRRLQRDALYPPSESARKIYLIEEAEALSLEAANSLLKLLEAPPPYLTFLLLTARPRLLPTIISRCQIIKLPHLSRAELTRQLAQRGFSSEELGWLMAFLQDRPERLERFSPGQPLPGELLEQVQQAQSELAELDGPALVQKLSPDEVPPRQREAALALLSRLPGLATHELLEIALALSKLLPEALGYWLEELLAWQRDLLLLSYGRTELIWNCDRLPELERALGEGRRSAAELPKLIAELELSRTDFESNANRQLWVEALLFKLCSPSR